MLRLTTLRHETIDEDVLVGSMREPIVCAVIAAPPSSTVAERIARIRALASHPVAPVQLSSEVRSRANPAMQLQLRSVQDDACVHVAGLRASECVTLLRALRFSSTLSTFGAFEALIRSRLLNYHFW